MRIFVCFTGLLALLAGLALIVLWVHSDGTDSDGPDSAESPLVPLPALRADLHCDALMQLRLNGGNLDDNPQLQVDLRRLRSARQNGQVFMAWSTTAAIKGGFAWRVILEQLDLFDRAAAASNGRLRAVRNGAELNQALADDALAAFLGVEGAYCLEQDHARLDVLAQRGVRILGPLWSHHNEFGDSDGQVPPRWNGLSPAGRELVGRCNELGLLLDAAHSSPATIRDMLEVSRDPIIDSHTACAALRNVPRNLDDELISAICSRGGVVAVMFHSPYLKADGQADIEDVLDQIEHVIAIGGYGCAAVGSDFDGSIQAAHGLPDIAAWPALLDGLRRRGLSEQQVQSVAGGNFERVFRQVCRY